MGFLTRTKVCGLTRPEDVVAVVDAGVDAVGFNFHPASPRVVDVERARELVALLPPFVVSVGLFVDAAPEVIEAVLSRVPLAMLQFHGDETEAECRRWGRPWLKVLRMRPEVDVERRLGEHLGAAGWLLDAYRPGVPGGTGETFDWSRIPASPARPVVLAGGLDATNVAAAIRAVRPWAVDVSGGVEASPGVKDRDRINAFVAAVRAADEEANTRARAEDRSLIDE